MSFAPTTYATSDLHGNLPPIPADAELLLLAGDICPDFRPRGARGQGNYTDTSGIQQAEWLNTQFRRWLEDRPEGCEVVGIWGNHDFVGEHPFLLPKDLPWTLLQDKTATVKGVTIHGTPWVPGLPYWAFYGSSEFLEARADFIPDCDVLLTHGPPRGAGDYIPGGEGKQVNKYGNVHGMSVGDTALTDRLQDPYRGVPTAVVCGHIHESRGEYLLKRRPGITEVKMDGSDHVSVVNVAAVDADYALLPNPWTQIYL